ncbi:hypothetical protein OZ401_004999 (plasmid) [Candidatus Chlorohelix allophototropha]|uniref:TrbL/VirB6 plasmid conjugal transfer protein n=1 Tax=Candidatus Chlorohelix allophototropha TaxID=3003348 RepID=A0ABY9BAN7_9CHLR|nr:hypothetical protein OZ401_004999 [Chloroflexota bacterium L227-S17]
MLGQSGKVYLAWSYRHPRWGLLLMLIPALVLVAAFGFYRVAQASGALYQIAPCAPPTDQSFNFDGNPGLDFDLGKWAGWLIGKICQWIAVVFFQLANHILGWGSGCNNIQLNFVTDTPWEYIANQSQPAFGDQLRNGLVWSVLSFQFFWLVLNLFWRRQQVGVEDILVRTLMGVALSGISYEIARWFLQICQALSQALNSGDKLRLFEGVLQVDTNGNIFNTLLSMFAAGVAVLFVLQMAIRLIYTGFLLYLLPLGGALWLNPGTQYYSRMLYSNFFATVFVQPLQLGVIAVTTMFVKGARAYADTSLAMLFGICGLFLALGLPRTFNAALGGSTPIGPVGLVLAGRMALGNLRQAGRAISGGNSHSPNSGNRGSGGNSGPANRSPWSGGGGGLSGLQPVTAGWGAPGNLRYGGNGGASPFRSKTTQTAGATSAYSPANSSKPASPALGTDTGVSPGNPLAGGVQQSPPAQGDQSVSPMTVGYPPAPLPARPANASEDGSSRARVVTLNPTPRLPATSGTGESGNVGAAELKPTSTGNSPSNPPLHSSSNSQSGGRPGVVDLRPYRPRPKRTGNQEGSKTS